MTPWKLLLAWVTASLRLLQDDLILCLSPCVWSPGHTALTHFALQLWATIKRQLGGCSCSLPLPGSHLLQRYFWESCSYTRGFKIWVYLRAPSPQLRLGLCLEAITLSIILTGNLNTNLALEYFSLVMAFCKSNLQQSLPSSTKQSEHWHFKWDKAIL